jgi:hypothetical protein
MGMIIKEYIVTGDLDSGAVRVLYDSGSGASFVRREIAERLGTASRMVNPVRFTMADGKEAFTVDQTANLEVSVDDTVLEYRFYIVDSLAEDMIIGVDMMQSRKIILDLANEVVSIDPRALYLRA